MHRCWRGSGLGGHGSLTGCGWEPASYSGDLVYSDLDVADYEEDLVWIDWACETEAMSDAFAKASPLRRLRPFSPAEVAAMVAEDE